MKAKKNTLQSSDPTPPSKKGSVTTITSPNVKAYPYDSVHVQVMWKVPPWELTFQLPQQTVIIRIASQGVFRKCLSLQISHIIVTVEFTPF